MKRTELKRSTPLRASKWGVSDKPPKPLKPRGETKRKKVDRQKSYYSSAVWKAKRREALARAGHQCEFLTPVTITTTARPSVAYEIRCTEVDRLHVHHKTNARFGGDELPEDLQVLCKHCHMTHHALEGKRIRI